MENWSRFQKKLVSVNFLITVLPTTPIEKPLCLETGELPTEN